MARKQKVTNSFRLFYAVLLVLIAAALLCLKLYVNGVMLEYESSSPDKYVLKLAADAAEKKGDLYSYMNEKCFEGEAAAYGYPEARRERFMSLCASDKLVSAAQEASSDTGYTVYNILAGDKPFLTLALKETGVKNKLGILTYSEWELAYAVLRPEKSDLSPVAFDENGLPLYKIYVPGGSQLYVDGAQVDLSSCPLSDMEGFETLADYVEIPKGSRFEMHDMAFEPVFEITNTDSITKAQEIADSLNPLHIAEIWSMFMTNDVAGSSHGLYTVKESCRLLPGTQLETLAQNWAGSVDITFVSHHRIDSWTNASVTNYQWYSDRLISCDVYLEKNMTLTTGAARTDVFDNRMYFVYADDDRVDTPGWYLAEMLSLEAAH